MLTIYNYELPIPLPHNRSTAQVQVDPGFVPLSVGEQNGKLVMWGKVEPDLYDDLLPGHPKPSIVVYVQGTGSDLCEVPDYAEFIGTAQMTNGFVWHVFAELLPYNKVKD